MELLNTMEPLIKGHIGAGYCVLCMEVVCSSEVQNVLSKWENERLGLRSVSYVERLFLLCPPLGGSFIGGSPVVHVHVSSPWRFLCRRFPCSTCTCVLLLEVPLQEVPLQYMYMCPRFLYRRFPCSTCTCSYLCILLLLHLLIY